MVIFPSHCGENFFHLNGSFCHLQREVSSTSLLAEYVFHTMCCTSDEEMCYSAYCTLMHLINICKTISNIKDQLSLALINIGINILSACPTSNSDFSSF